MLEVIGFSLLLVISVRFKGLSDRKKIEKIFEYTRTWVTSEKGVKKKCKFIRKNNLGEVGNEYIFKLPLGMPYKKLEYLNDNIGVFKDGLNKNVELSFKNGFLFIAVYEKDLSKFISFKEVYNEVESTNRKNV